MAIVQFRPNRKKETPHVVFPNTHGAGGGARSRPPVGRWRCLLAESASHICAMLFLIPLLAFSSFTNSCQEQNRTPSCGARRFLRHRRKAPVAILLRTTSRRVDDPRTQMTCPTAGFMGWSTCRSPMRPIRQHLTCRHAAAPGCTRI